MRHHNSKHSQSRTIARDRLKQLLLAERIDCSPRMMQMMKNDVCKTVNRYLLCDSPGITVRYNRVTNSVLIDIPLKESKGDTKGESCIDVTN